MAISMIDIGPNLKEVIEAFFGMILIIFIFGVL